MIYICGSKDPMSIDVERALCEVISKCAGINPDAAEDYLLQLEDDGRYIKEVY
jgi:sulfite reductase (NADPH) flavoprotein alpha-component